MMFERFRRNLPPFFKDANSLVHIATVSRCAGGDDTAFTHQGSIRRNLTELGPQLIDVTPVSERAMKIHEHRVLFNGAGFGPELFKLFHGQIPFAESIEREPIKLTHVSEARVGLHERLQRPFRILELLALELAGCSTEQSPRSVATVLPMDLCQFFVHVPRFWRTARKRSTLNDRPRLRNWGWSCLI